MLIRCAVYQKVVPPPVFALLIELTSLTGGATGGPPAPAPASVADIDDGLSSPTGRSLGSGSGEWENVGA
jgi:import receptor subunit TOM20